MGEHEGGAQPPSGLLLNGLLPNEAASVVKMVDSDRWMRAEERTAELIACIQPNPASEERRIAVADYVQRLIMKCFPCQVFTFGSVPLKTYLPDGDIDLTAFSKNPNLKDTWAHQVRDMLESEEKNENAEFCVKEVQYIQAEVKIIKCLVDNIVVDISLNQLGGLCTLCFLEEVDNLIDQDHLFKRSIILIKAWCYYESRLLGAHHGLISTYALETLVLYIFHVFNNSFAGPLEVLYRFLEFFSMFDWDNFCVSLSGPVPISSLPDVTAEPPRKDGGDLLLSKVFLQACGTCYAVFPGGQENQGQPFASKHLNVIDPLRVNNNLGRSVSKGNFYRIRYAFALAAKRLARLLDCPDEELVFEVNQFFMNTWKRHVSRQRPDAPVNDFSLLRLSHDEIPRPENLRNNNHKIDRASNLEFNSEEQHVSRRGLSQHSNLSSVNTFKSSDIAKLSHTMNQKSHGNQYNSMAFNQGRRGTSSNTGAHVDKGQRIVKADNSVNDVHGRFLFARTRSSPELTDSFSEVSSQGRRTRVPESIKGNNSFAKWEDGRKKNLEPHMATNYVRIDDSSDRHNSPHQVIDSAAESNNVSNSYHDESGMGVVGEDFASVIGAGEMQMMREEEQDLLNMMASPAALGFTGQAHVPMNFAPGHLPFPFPPSILASMGYAQRNMGSIPFIEHTWGTNMQFHPGLVPSNFTPYFPGMGFISNPQDIIETGHENFSPAELNPAEVDNDFWHEQERHSASGVEVDNGNFEMHPDDEQSTSGGSNFTLPSRVGSSRSSDRIQQNFSKENQGSTREEHIDKFHYKDGRRNEVCCDDRTAYSQLPCPSPSNSFRSKTSSESSWDGSSAKSSKSIREKRGKKNALSAPSAALEKGKNVSEFSSNQVDDENREWTPVSTMDSDLSERSTKAPVLSSIHVPRHQMSAFEVAQTSGSESPFPIAPMVIGPGSTQRMVDDSGVAPFTFYPTGPPVPFVTMLPFYNFPTESSDTSSNFNVEEGVQNSDSGHKVDSYEGYNQLEGSSPSNSMTSAAIESPEPKADILNSDFISHWQNLQYGRFCQDTIHPPSVVYPSPVMVPPVYLQGRYPWDGPGRPVSANMNPLTEFMSYGPRLVPVAPLQSVSNRPATYIYQRFADDMPRHRSGTGTYLPNPKVSAQGRHSTNARRGNYNFDRGDHHGDREGNMNSKVRATGRAHNRNQTEKPCSKPERLTTSENRVERQWGSHRHDSLTPNQIGPVRSNYIQNNPANVAYGVYPTPGMNPSGVSSNGPTMPSVVMFYPYDHNMGYSTPAEQVEFGSIGPPMGFSGVNELSQPHEGNRSGGAFEEQRSHGGSTHRSSPDQPSSPHVSRGS